MLGVIWYFASIYIAYLWISRSPALRRFLTWGEVFFAAVTVGTIGGAWLVYLTACLTGVLSESTICLATAIGYAAAYMRSPVSGGPAETALPPPRSNSPVASAAGVGPRSSRISGSLPAPPALPFTRDDGIAFALVFVISLWLWPMYSHRMIPSHPETNEILTGGSCYGDLPIHMTIANSFIVGVNMEIKWGTMISPIFAGEKMTYPFLPDFHAAILVQLGSSMRTGFLIPGFAMACALWALIFYTGVRITRSRIGSFMAVFLTMFAGGMGGWRWAMANGWDNAFTQDVIQHDPTGEWKMLWFAFIPHIMLPQRGGNFAYPMAVLTVLLMWRATDAAIRMAPHHRASLLLHSALFAASLPMVQAHAFIGVGIIIGVFFVLDAHKWLQDAKLLIGWALAGITALLLALPQMTQFSKTVNAGFYGKFMTYGWLFHNYEFGQPYGVIGFYNFWWYSVGPALLVFTACLLVYCFQSYQAFAMGRRLVKDHGSSGVTHYLKSIASELGDPDSVFAGTDAREPFDPYDADSTFSLKQIINGLHSSVVGPLASMGITKSLAKSFRLEDLDAHLSTMNALSVNGRSLDSIKLWIGAFGVFLLGNYVNLQPWDRDNAKIFYIWVFVAAMMNGGLLLAPFEYLVGIQPGTRVIKEVVAVLWSPCTPAPTKNFAAKPAVARLQVHTERAVSLSLCVLSPVIMFFCMLSGYILFSQEFRDNGVMLDRDALSMGEYIKEHVNRKAVVMHSNYHVQPSGAIAARPSLVSYYGWVSNHGYNSHERLGDRDYAMDHALMDNDDHAYDLFRKWGVRYVVGEHIKRHERAPDTGMDADTFLNGRLKRLFTAGRYELFEVQGYDFPPS